MIDSRASVQIVALALLGSFVAGTCWASSDPGPSSIDVEADWPRQLRPTQSTPLSIAVAGGRNDPIQGASVEVGYLVDGRPRSPEHLVQTLTDEPQSFVLLSENQTGENGVADLDLPSTRQLRRNADSNLLSDRGSITLILRVKARGTPSIEYLDYPLSTRADIALQSDRSLYRTGQTIRMRAVVVERFSGRPIAGKKPVVFRVIGPTGTPLFRERVEVGATGVGASSFRLSDHARSGTYRLVASRGSSRVERTVEVSAYEKPRFDVELQTNNDRAKPGQKLSGTLTARWFYGEALADADVELQLALPSASGARPTFEGATDDSGTLDWELSVPNELPESWLDHVDVTAVVTAPSGRARRVTNSVTLGGRPASIEVLPRRGAQFIANRTNGAVAVVQNAEGRPIEGATMKLQLPGMNAPKRLTADDNGRAKFDWTPPSYRILEADGEQDDARAAPAGQPRRGEPPRARAEPRGTVGKKITAAAEIDAGNAVLRNREFDVVVAPGHYAHLQPATATVRAGERLSFDVRAIPGGDCGQTCRVVAFHRGAPVARTRLDGTDDGDVEGSIELGPAARGLTHLVAYDANSKPFAWTPVWVRQSTTDRVEISTDASSYQPGERATVKLAFPPAAREQTETPVTFGLWAVDEALHELQENASVPIARLLRHDAETVDAALQALESVGDEARDSLSSSEASARMALAGPTPRIRTSNPPRSADHAMAAQSVRPYVVAWCLVLVAALLVLVALAGRMLWREIDWDELSLGAAAALVAAPALLGGGLWLMHFVSDELFIFAVIAAAFGLLLWSAASLLLVVASALQHRNFGRWAAAATAASIVGVATAVAANAGVAVEEPWITFLRYGAAVPVAALALQSFAWVMILPRSDYWYGAAGLAAFFWAEILVVIGLTVGGCAKAGEEVRGRLRGVFGSSESKTGRAEKSQRPSGRTEPSRSGDGALRIRDYFPDTALWRPAIPSDSAGEATTSFVVPDSITSWRLTASAHTSDGRFGSGTTRVEVRKPFFAEVDPPQQLVTGDRIDIPVALVDGREDPARGSTVRVDVDAEDGLEITDPPPATVTVPAGERRVETVGLRAGDPGEATLEIRARPQNGRSGGDALRRTVEIRPDGRTRTVSHSGSIGDGWERSIRVPDAAVRSSTSARLQFNRGRVAPALDGIESMLQKPHGCFEQTSSSTFPNALILESLEDTSPQKWHGGADAYEKTRERAERLVSTGYQRLVTFQTEGGGFALWRPERQRGGTPETVLTAYGILQIDTMRPHLSASPSQVLGDAARWLADQQLDSGHWSYERSHNREQREYAKVRSTSYAVWALSKVQARGELQSHIDRGVEALVDRIEDVDDDYELALAANALQAAGELDRARSILARLASSVERDQKRGYWTTDEPSWMGGTGRYATIETTALAARAYATLDMRSDLQRAANNYLASSRSPGGGWGSTQATAWALEAISELRAGTRRPVDLDVRVDGAPMPREDRGPDGTAVLAPDSTVSPSFTMAPLDPGSTRVSVVPSQTTDATAQLVLRYVADWESAAARGADEPFDLELALESRELLAGQPAEIDVTLRAPEGRSAGASVVELPVPPGGWADDTELRQMVDEGAVTEIERRPRHLVVYLDGVDEGETVEFDYRIVPQLQGTYRLPTLKAWRYYNPRPLTARDGGEIDVDG